MKPILLILLLAAPAAAASYYPNSAGFRYCQLRQMGVDKEQAMRLAIRDNWAQERYSQTVTIDGKTYSMDNLDFARWITGCDGQ